MPIYLVLSIERAPFPLTRFVARQVVRFSIYPVWVIKFRTRGPGREPRPIKALCLTGPQRGKRSALGRRLARAVAQRRRRGGEEGERGGRWWRARNRQRSAAYQKGDVGRRFPGIWRA